MNDKVGNILVYLSSNIKNLSLTKILKLIYIIDETSMIETGVPVTWFEHKAWKMGPVAPVIYDYININCAFVHDDNEYITATNKTNNGITWKLIEPSVDFDDSEFTDYELDLLDRVVKKFGKWSADELVQYLHREESLWSKIRKENKLNFELQGGVSDVTIPLTRHLKDDVEKQNIYSSAYEAMQFERMLNSKRKPLC